MTELDPNDHDDEFYLRRRPDYAAAMKALAAVLATLDVGDVYDLLEDSSAGLILLADLNYALAEHHPAFYDKLQEMLAA